MGCARRVPDEIGVFRCLVADFAARVGVIDAAAQAAFRLHLEPNPLVFTGRQLGARHDGVRIGSLVSEQVDNLRRVEVDGFPVVAVGVFEFHAVETNADFRCVLDRRITDAEVEIAYVASGRRHELRRVIDVAPRTAARGQRRSEHAHESGSEPFRNSGHLSFPHDLS